MERGITHRALRGSSLGFLVAGSRALSVNPSQERSVRPRLIVNRALDFLKRDYVIELEEENAPSTIFVSIFLPAYLPVQLPLTDLVFNIVKRSYRS